MKRFLSLLSFLCLFIAWSYAAELNIYASGLRVNSVNAETNEVTIDYFLNAPATALEFQLLNASTGAIVKTVAITGSGNLAKGSHSGVSLDLSDAVGGTYKWALKATAETREGSSPVKIGTYGVGQTNGRAVALDKNPESPYYGNIYTINGNAIGLYGWDAGMNTLFSGSAVATNGWNSGNSSPCRASVGEDGLVYICDWSDSNPNIRIFNPATPSADAVTVFGGTASGSAGIMVNESSKTIHGSMPYVMPFGSGEDTYIITADEDFKQSSRLALYRYNIGTASSPYTAEPTVALAIGNITSGKIANGNITFAPSKAGGWWVSQHRYSDATANPCLVHISSSNTMDFSTNAQLANSTVGYNNQASFDINNEQNLIVTTTSNSVFSLLVWEVTWTNHVPSLSLKYNISTGFNATCLKPAIDDAGNIYAVAAGKPLTVWSLPKEENTCITPAASSRTITLSTLISVTHVTGVTLDVTSKTMVVGETFTLTPTIAPADATDKTYSWSTSDGSVATISDGLVTAVGVGTADITVTTTDGSFTATCAVTVEAPDPLSGTYKIGGAEADFATLYSAVDYLNHWGISGNTTFLICDDLTETHNIGFVNSSAYTITIKPDADVDRTISFTQVADNTGPSGALVIGSNAADIGWAATATRNIVIDGLASAGATHKMTIKTPSTFGATAGPIVIYGSVTNTIIRNCRIINELSPTAMCITLRNNQPTGSASTSDDYPDGVIIENNYIATPNANNGQGIYINGSKATTTGPSNTVIRNNEINASSRGVFLYGLNSITIDNNTFRMNSASGYDCAAIYGLTSAGNINIRNNKILSLTSNNTSETTAHGLNGIIAGSGGNWLIENNLITGFDATSDGRKGHLIGIKTGGTPSSIKILHNTFYMPAFSHTMTSTLLSAKPVTLLYIAGGTPIVKNNIFISQETSCVNSLIRGALNANCTSNVFYSAGGNGVIVDGANACANWDELCSKYSAQALTSTCQLVEFTENYKPTSAYVDNANLAVTPLAEVTTDIEGTTRNATKTYAGCYEASNIALVYSGVSSLTLPATASIERGNTLELTPTVSPAIAINRTQFWNSDNTAVATVDNSGVVTAVAVGTAHITVTVDGVTSDACTVTVYRTDFDVTWVPNGATTTSVAPASNNDLWTQFMTDYNTYYGLSRGIQTIDHVRWFLNNVNCIDFITNPESPWCWLGKIILPAAEAAGRTLDTEVKCSFDIQAFFNQLPAESGEYGYGDYTIAGQIENWLPLWKEANNYLPPTMSATDEMPVIRKGNDLLAGWYDNSSFTGAPVTSVTADMTLYAKWIAPIELDEASADNIAKIEANDGELANVILRRTFEATGYWYTLVLPFDVSAEQMEETFGAGYEVTVLESSYRKSETAIYLKFVPQTYIKAGEPCLFKPGRDIDEAIFRSVTIDNTTPEVNTTIVNMVGLYAPTDVTLSDNNYYLGSTNYLHEYVAIYQNTKGFRAYFHFNEAMAAGCSARVVFREDTATELEDLPEVNTPSVQKVIRDGQLIIIREGKEYTTQGQLIQ